MPVSPDHEIIVIGAGFSGIGVAIKLRQSGFDDFVIIEAGDEAGGTWYWNTYPGVAVDIPSFSYQFSFEQRPNWSRSYAPGRELKGYAEHCVDKYGIRGHIRFGVTIASATYDDTRNLWRLTTAAGDELTARYVVNASGVLVTPNYPDIPGVTDFAGDTLHTARWNHDVDLAGKRVAIIGTGASAVQIIPAIAPDVESLTVFQRTAIWCLPKPDFTLPRPVQKLMARLPGVRHALRLASHAFVEVTFPIAGHYFTAIPGSHRWESWFTRYLRSQLNDPKLAEQLTPRYAPGCKRPSFHNGYYAAFNRANVALQTTPISHISASAVHTTDGTAHEIDVLILATGFKVFDPDNLPTYRLTGRDGVEQGRWWQENRYQAYHGISVPGFPNHFSVFGPYGYNGASYFTLIEAQTAHILRCLRHARATGANRVEVTAAANDRYFAEMLSRRGRQVFWQDSCSLANSYYFSPHGDVPLKPTTTVETFWRSNRFALSDYGFDRTN